MDRDFIIYLVLVALLSVCSILLLRHMTGSGSAPPGPG